MCFKENYCMIQQSPFILLIARDMLTEWLLRQELTMTWAFSTEMARNYRKKKTENPPICLESLNIFASKMIKELGIVSFCFLQPRATVAS